jgi:hypothetical protein
VGIWTQRASLVFNKRRAKPQEGDAELEGRIRDVSATKNKKTANPAEYRYSRRASTYESFAARHLKLLTTEFESSGEELDTTTSVIFDKDEPRCRKGTQKPRAGKTYQLHRSQEQQTRLNTLEHLFLGI